MFRNSNDRWGTLFNELKDKDMPAIYNLTC